jgi:probable rRNA maturation factor
MHPTVILKSRVPGLTQTKLAEFVAEVCKQIKLAGIVTVLVTSSKEMRALNRRFRGKPQPTDVLSFPGPAFVEGFAGDIAVSADIAGQNARELGHSTAAEVKILALHGILHLAGYDHESDQGDMKRIEQRLRRKLSLPTSLIERASARKTGMRSSYSKT